MIRRQLADDRIRPEGGGRCQGHGEAILPPVVEREGPFPLSELGKTLTAAQNSAGQGVDPSGRTFRSEGTVFTAPYAACARSRKQMFVSP